MVKNNLIKKNWLSSINRLKSDTVEREKFLRLDKNERVISFEKKFINYLKKKINTFNISSYPDIEKTKKLLSKKLIKTGKMRFL